MCKTEDREEVAQVCETGKLQKPGYPFAEIIAELEKARSRSRLNFPALASSRGAERGRSVRLRSVCLTFMHR